MSVKVNTLYGTFDEEQLKQLKGNIDEIVLCFQEIQAQNESIKDIVDLAYDNLKIPKKIIKKMAKAQFKQNFKTEVAEHSEFESLYEALTEIN
jgi:exonuclease III